MLTGVMAPATLIIFLLSNRDPFYHGVVILSCMIYVPLTVILSSVGLCRKFSRSYSALFVALLVLNLGLLTSLFFA